ncbi:hypothetical protein FHL15_010463 [Xylaria flabelliformis]|uniref:Uncharacterized protein n=1 Tax=Xylaria flabelliformis TaxID=2512241 RepID=A0A553HKY7_9PEZI|nr:hypothetical protein FHL15_010463 [Xylaria flabelliformis]
MLAVVVAISTDVEKNRVDDNNDDDVTGWWMAVGGNNGLSLGMTRFCADQSFTVLANQLLYLARTQNQRKRQLLRMWQRRLTSPTLESENCRKLLRDAPLLIRLAARNLEVFIETATVNKVLIGPNQPPGSLSPIIDFDEFMLDTGLFLFENRFDVDE